MISGCDRERETGAAVCVLGPASGGVSRRGLLRAIWVLPLAAHGQEQPADTVNRRAAVELEFCDLLVKLESLAGERVEFWAFLKQDKYGPRLKFVDGNCEAPTLWGRKWPAALGLGWVPPAGDPQAEARIAEVRALLEAWGSPNRLRSIEFVVKVKGRIQIAQKDESAPGGYRGFGDSGNLAGQVLVEDIRED